MNAPFVPNITRFKKHRRRIPKGKEQIDQIKLVKYQFGIQSLSDGRMFSNHFDMCRKTISNFFRRQTKIYMRGFPYHSYTTKPHDVRRGRGKGSIDGWYHAIRKNKIILEFESPTIEQALKVATIVRSKLPLKVRLVTKEIILEDIKKYKENNEAKQKNN